MPWKICNMADMENSRIIIVTTFMLVGLYSNFIYKRGIIKIIP